MSHADARETEIELLKSMFHTGDELIFEDTEDTETWLPSEQRTFGFVVKLPEGAELTVQLPPGYPSGDSSNPVIPTITVRLLPTCQTDGINERVFSSRFNAWLEEMASSGEPVVCSAIDWIRSELASKSHQCNELKPQPIVHQQPVSCFKEPNSTHGDVNQTMVCLWIVSHHIRSPIKRRLILEWAAELELTGCSMPGRPGLVIAEGRAAQADEYWSRLRGLQWKHIQLRDREVLGTSGYSTRRFTDGFHELFLAHQSRFQWLNQRGVSSDQFKLVFGIPGRLPQTTEVGNKRQCKK